MKEELENQLFRNYPLLYADLYSETVHTPFALFGFEIGDGWYRLIDELSAKLEAAIAQMGEYCAYCGHTCAKHGGWNCVGDSKEEICPCDKYEKWHTRVSQVKEKYGELRFYIDGTVTSEMEVWISEAEDKAEATCELCGEAGRNRPIGNWWQTRCESCRIVMRGCDG